MAAIRILERKTLSREKYPLERMHFSFDTPNGESIEKTIEVYERPSAATILLMDPENQKVLLTGQVRLPAFINGRQERLIESCAGLIEDGESPEETIAREVMEETGYGAENVCKIMELYSSPGANTELIHYYTGTYSSGNKIAAGGGKKNEGEHISLIEWTYRETADNLKAGRIKDAKTVVLLQYALLNDLLTSGS